MPTSTVDGIKSIFDYGYLPGADASIAAQQAVSAGKDLYFPAGNIYRFNKTVKIPANFSIDIIGGGPTSILNAGPNLVGHIFRVDRAAYTGFSNLAFVGRGPVIDPTGNDAENAIYSYGAGSIHVESCYFTGFAGIVLMCHATITSVLIDDCQFQKNQVLHWDDGSIPSGDIVLWSGVGNPGCRSAVITRNRCWSNNRLGICSFDHLESLVISGNDVASSLDSDGSDPILKDDFRRKEGITINYYTDNDGRKPWECTCTGNTIRNVGWSGIYLAASSKSAPHKNNEDGPNCTISGNTIAKCCMNLCVGNTPRLQAGISLRGLQLATCVGNVVRDIDPQRTAPTTNRPAGIRVYPSVQSTGGASQSVIAICGNVIRDVGGRAVDICGGNQGMVVESGNAAIRCDP